jgi:NACHT domain
MYNWVTLRIPKVCLWISLTPFLCILNLVVTDTCKSIEAFEEKVSACQNNLFLTDPLVDRENLISTKGTRVAGTCKWITQNGTYQSWLHGGIRLLWISGGPGKGKTMMSIFLTEELEGVTLDTDDTKLVFYFCSHQDNKRNTAITILRGLVYQIIVKHPKLAKHVLPYFESPEKAQATLSSLEALWIIFRMLVQDPDLSTTFCVLDGLDECDEGTIRVLVPRIVDIFSPENLALSTGAFRIVIVSRDMAGLRRCTRVKLDPDNEERVANDIKLFISAKVQELSRIEGFSEEFGTTIQKTLLERSEGTFLWIGFVMNELSQKKTCTEVLEALNAVPKGLPAIYGQMLRKIESNRRYTSSMILRWITMAFRPLTLQELAAAIGIQPSSTLITPEQAVRDQVTLCGLFLKVQGQGLGLVHQSAKDYLL